MPGLWVGEDRGNDKGKSNQRGIDSMGLTQIEELNSRPMRALAAGVILDAISEAKLHPTDKRGRDAYHFLMGENGMLQSWLDFLNDIDADAIMIGIKKLMTSNFKVPPPPKPKRKQQPTIGIQHGDKILTVQQAADILGFSYSTVYRRHELYPSYSMEELRLVMPTKKDGRCLCGRPGKKNGGCK